MSDKIVQLTDKNGDNIYPISANPDNIINMFYPIGSYYETSNTSFDPNVSWGGTWVEDSAGRVAVSYSVNDSDFNTIGKTGGSKYLQSHNHTGATEYGYVTSMRVVAATGTQRSGNHVVGYQSGDYIDITNTNNYPGGHHTHTFTTDEAGNGNSGNLQPYVVVRRWHRIA